MKAERLDLLLLLKPEKWADGDNSAASIPEIYSMSSETLRSLLLSSSTLSSWLCSCLHFTLASLRIVIPQTLPAPDLQNMQTGLVSLSSLVTIFWSPLPTWSLSRFHCKWLFLEEKSQLRCMDPQFITLVVLYPILFFNSAIQSYLSLSLSSDWVLKLMPELSSRCLLILFN